MMKKRQLWGYMSKGTHFLSQNMVTTLISGSLHGCQELVKTLGETCGGVPTRVFVDIQHKTDPGHPSGPLALRFVLVFWTPICPISVIFNRRTRQGEEEPSKCHMKMGTQMFVSTREIPCGNPQAYLNETLIAWEVFRKKYACRSHLMGAGTNEI